MHRFQRSEQSYTQDGYPMPIANMLVDAAAGHKVISFMDGNAGYNQIFMAEENIAKTAFRCPGAIGCDDLWFEECRCNLSEGNE